MKRRIRSLALLLVIALPIYSGYGFACGSTTAIKSFRLALASSGPLVNSLVAAGAIPQTRAAAIIGDFDAGAQCGLTLQDDFAAVPKDAPDARARKLTAATKAFNCFRAVVSRQSFAAHPRLQQIANIADGVLASLVVFYSDGKASPSESATSVSGATAVATITATNEADLERQMATQMKTLELLMKP